MGRGLLEVINALAFCGCHSCGIALSCRNVGHFLGDFVVSSSQTLLQLDDISNVTLCVFIMTPCVFISLLSHMQRSTETLPVAAVLQPHRHKAGVGTWRSLSKVRLVTAGGTTFVSPQYVYRIFLSFPFQNSVSTLNRHFIRYAFQVPFISILLCTI